MYEDSLGQKEILELTFLFNLNLFHSLYFWCYFIYLFLAALHSLWDLSFPDQGLNLGPRQWKCRVPTTGLQGKSLPVPSLWLGSPLRSNVRQVNGWITVPDHSTNDRGIEGGEGAFSLSKGAEGGTVSVGEDTLTPWKQEEIWYDCLYLHSPQHGVLCVVGT